MLNSVDLRAQWLAQNSKAATDIGRNSGTAKNPFILTLDIMYYSQSLRYISKNYHFHGNYSMAGASETTKSAGKEQDTTVQQSQHKNKGTLNSLVSLTAHS